MSVIDLDSSSKQPRKKKLGFALIASGCIAGVIALGSAFAGGISLNGGGSAEFGQGYLITTTCDPNGIEVKPVYAYLNSEGEGKFVFSTIQIEGVSANCAGKDLIIKVYNNAGQAIDITTDGTTDYKEVRIYFNPFSNVGIISEDDTQPNIVSLSGYWADQFQLVDSPPIEIFTLSNLSQIEPDAEVTPGGPASGFFEVDSEENAFEITFDPAGADALGFADARDAYRISIQSVDHQS